MLIPNYSITKNKSLNHKSLVDTNDAYSTQKYKSITYPTAPLSHFDNTDTTAIKKEIDDQYNLAKETLKLQQQYDLISKASAQETLSQYQHFFFHQGYAFQKDELLRYLNQTDSLSTLRTPSSSSKKINEEPDPFVDDEPRQINPAHEYYTISRQDIRNITKYTFNPIPPFSQTKQPVYIHWQYLTLNSKADRLVIDGSRQMGKSLILAQLITEESFLEGDILVAAPQQSTTDVIKNYILHHTRDFDDGTFIYKERKKYIENTITGTRIHFRTLEDGAKNIRGLTVRLTIIDEAQLAPKKVMEEVVIPTMTTTGGRLILIGTAVEDLSSYMYYVIDSVKHNTRDFNTPDTFSAEVITVSADDNPMIHPKQYRDIQSKKQNPAVQREYYNAWGKLEDALFSPTIIQPHQANSYIPFDLYQQSYIAMGIDPARKSDNSAYSISITLNQKTITIESGVVPQNYHNNWKDQAQFFLSVQQRIKQQFPKQKLYTSFDATGVGDAVAPIFLQEGVSITHLIVYTQGNTLSEEYQSSIPTIKLGKSRLINSYLNMVQSSSYAIIRTSNEGLIDEIRHIQLTETSQGQMAIKSNNSAHDDITNATMTSTFLLQHLKLISSPTYNTSSPLQTHVDKAWQDEINLYRKPKFINQTSESYFL